MKSRDLNSQHQRLRSLISKADLSEGFDFEMQAHWAQYLCVISAGFIENSVKIVYTQYSKQSSPSPIARYVGGQLSRIQNPKAQKILETAKSFKSEWGDGLEKFLSENGRKEAVDSIMNNRHAIAHGRSANITIHSLKDYLRKSVEVINFLEKQCGIGSHY